MDSGSAVREGSVVGCVGVPAVNGVWGVAARLACCTPGPQLVTCPMDRGYGMSLCALSASQSTDIDDALAHGHGHRWGLEASNGNNSAFCGMFGEGRASLETGRHQVGALLELVDDEERGVQQGNDSRVVPERVDGGVEAVAQLEPEDALVAIIVGADIESASDGAEVWAGRRGKAGRLGIVGQYRASQGGESGGIISGRVDGKVCDDLVRCPAPVARLERGEGLDLGVVNTCVYTRTAGRHLHWVSS